MSYLQPLGSYVPPTYSRLGPEFEQLPMDRERAADLARAVRSYARSIDEKPLVFRMCSKLEVHGRHQV